MTNIEEILNRTRTDNSAYRVPEGYFDTLHDRIMQNVMTQQQNDVSSKGNKHKTNKFILTPGIRYAVAACFTGIIVAAGIIAFNKINNVEEQEIANNTQNSQDVTIEEYTDQCFEYAMVDNEDIYMYLADQ